MKMNMYATRPILPWMLVNLVSGCEALFSSIITNPAIKPAVDIGISSAQGLPDLFVMQRRRAGTRDVPATPNVFNTECAYAP